MKLSIRRKLQLSTVFVLLTAVMIHGCDTDDFLRGDPQGTLDELTLANERGVEGTLIGAYRSLDWNEGVWVAWGSAASNWVWASAPSDDAYKGSELDDQPPITDIEMLLWGTGGTHGYLNDAWRHRYDGINRANATIRLLNRILEEDPDALSDPQAESIRGEALFLRAHQHFEAWRLWGNIPYYFEDDEDMRKPNIDSGAVLGHIINDLDQASGLLPDTPRNGQVGRVTRWTALAYKGRVQMYAEDYPGALQTLREVRNSGPYELEENYHRVWTGFVEYANGPETILAFQASSNDGDPNGHNANYGERLNFPHAGSPFGCCGFHQPSQNLVNYFRVDTNGHPIALSDPNWNDNNENMSASFTADMPLDPRIDWTVGRDGVPYKDWGLHAPAWIRAPGVGGPYSPKKNVHEDASGAESVVGWLPAQQNSVNIHIYRYADLLLLLAEAEVEAGSLENAREIVNEVRERASVAAQGPGDDVDNIAVPIDDPSITWADYQVGQYISPWVDQNFAREAVRAERRLELAMEGERFYDLRRWGIAQQVLNDYLAVEQNRRGYLGAASQFQDRHNLYPIPNFQIELSRVEGESRLQQNPDW